MGGSQSTMGRGESMGTGMDNPMTSSTKMTYVAGITCVFIILLISACCLLCVSFNFSPDDIMQSPTGLSAISLLCFFMICLASNFYISYSDVDTLNNRWEQARSANRQAKTYFGRT